ncbi:MAG: SAM-dependent methyltransferase [Pseudomonadota bacterium]
MAAVGARTSAVEAATAMKGGGYYSERTRGAKHVIDRAADMLLDAARSIPGPADDGQPLRIADYGTADGGTSLDTICQTVAALSERFPSRQVEVVYTDLPSNDFSALFRNVITGGDGADSEQPSMPGARLGSFPHVFVSAIGRGFHTQLLADNSLDIGFSATAMHYVSEKPCEISSHVHMVGAESEERAAFARQAGEDWERILLARAAELRAGGRLVICNFGIDEQGRYLGNTGGVNMFDTFDRLWRAEFDAGRITAEEVRRATFAQAYRTREEFCAPLLDEDGPVFRAGLRLRRADMQLTPCPYRAAFDHADGAMDARAFAQSYVPTLRSWSETVFLQALDGARGADERAAIVDGFYRAYEDLVAADPEGHAMDYVHCYLEIEKTG